MHLVPAYQRDAPIKHLRLSAATTSSTSLAAPGTGYTYVPIYAWGIASGVSSIMFTNGTAGSNLFEFKTQAGGLVDVCFWEEPSLMSGNMCPVIETVAGIGVHDIHVWYKKVRSGAGQDGLGQ
jgi:hypothetical protein